MRVHRVGIQRRELEAALLHVPEGVVRHAAVALTRLLDGHTVIVEERIGELPSGELLIEETILSIEAPT